MDCKQSKAPTPTTGKKPRAVFTKATDFLASSSRKRQNSQFCPGKRLRRVQGPKVYSNSIILHRALVPFIDITMETRGFLHPALLFLVLLKSNVPLLRFCDMFPSLEKRWSDQLRSPRRCSRDQRMKKGVCVGAFPVRLTNPPKREVHFRMLSRIST